ncbi:MAG TPA: cobalt ECF transporter T component CbiQ [Gemmataceae bacterium]|nr:cobalt ECF transporter T component CbiQ [Gemmataceae bacterium]
MTLAFSTPPRTHSFLSRLDPRWKLAALLFAAAVAATLRTLPAAALTLGAALLLALLARLPRRWFLERLGALALFLALFTLPLPWLLADAGPGWTWGPLRFSFHGVEVGLLLCAKAVTIVTLFLIVQATAPLESTLKAAHSLRVPGLLVQLSLLSYRYLFVLADELGRLRIAVRVRGYRNRVSRHSYRTAGHVAGTLLVRGYERAERVGQAMRCRGFDGQFRSLTEFSTRPVDVFAFLLLTALAAALAAWDWLPRLSG